MLWTDVWLFMCQFEKVHSVTVVIVINKRRCGDWKSEQKEHSAWRACCWLATAAYWYFWMSKHHWQCECQHFECYTDGRLHCCALNDLYVQSDRERSVTERQRGLCLLLYVCLYMVLLLLPWFRPLIQILKGCVYEHKCFHTPRFMNFKNHVFPLVFKKKHKAFLISTLIHVRLCWYKWASRTKPPVFQR